MTEGFGLWIVFSLLVTETRKGGFQKIQQCAVVEVGAWEIFIFANGIHLLFISFNSMTAVFCYAIFTKPFSFFCFKVGFLFFIKVEMQERAGQDSRSFSEEEVCVSAAFSVKLLLECCQGVMLMK